MTAECTPVLIKVGAGGGWYEVVCTGHPDTRPRIQGLHLARLVGDAHVAEPTSRTRRAEWLIAHAQNEPTPWPVVTVDDLRPGADVVAGPGKARACEPAGGV